MEKTTSQLEVILEKLKNPGTITTIVSTTLLIASNCGLEVKNEAVMTFVRAACTICMKGLK